MSVSQEIYKPTEEARKLYETHVAQTWTDQQASSDAFDNNLLTLSSAALGLSLAFLKDIVPLESAEWMKTLYFSWASFVGCILVTVASFQFAIYAQKANAVYLRKYYLEGSQEYFDKKSPWSRLIPWCALLASILLLAGISLTVVFATNNVKHFREIKRWQKTSPSKGTPESLHKTPETQSR